MNRGTFVNERITLAVFEFSVFRMSAFAILRLAQSAGRNCVYGRPSSDL